MLTLADAAFQVHCQRSSISVAALTAQLDEVEALVLEGNGGLSVIKRLKAGETSDILGPFSLARLAADPPVHVPAYRQACEALGEPIAERPEPPKSLEGQKRHFWMPASATKSNSTAWLVQAHLDEKKRSRGETTEMSEASV